MQQLEEKNNTLTDSIGITDMIRKKTHVVQEGQNKNIARKIGALLIGIVISSLGVSLSVKSNLGATPIGVCPAVFSQPLHISTGMATGILLGLFFLIQIFILKKEFSLFQISQLAATFVYSGSVDLITNVLSYLPDQALWQRAIYCILGIVILAIGIFIMLKADYIMLPQDAVVQVICKQYNQEYGKIKIIMDSVLTVIAAVGSWILHKKLVHVGVGTIVAAIFVGKIISWLKGIKGLNRMVTQAIGEEI
ncbi:MAG: YczE/YyaS/YitT family protein [Christensenellales bacterium]